MKNENKINPTKLDELSFIWTKAKAEESAAKKRRLEIEEQILANIKSKDEGVVSDKQNFYEVSAGYGFTRSVDEERLSEIRKTQPATVTQFVDSIFQMVTKIDLRALRYCEEHEPEKYKIISQAITSKPKKPSISIRRI